MTESTALSPRSAACCTTPVATRFTRATGDCVLRREPPPLARLRPPLFRALLFLAPPLRLEERLLDLRDDDLRPLLLRRAEDFLPPRDDLVDLLDDLRAPPERLLDRFRPPPLRPPLLRPEDPDRDRFLPPPRLLDFLAAAIRKLRVGGFVEPIARFAHNNDESRRVTLRTLVVARHEFTATSLSPRAASPKDRSAVTRLTSMTRACVRVVRPSVRRSA